MSGPLQAYLAQHDTPCPGCGYNLRGLAANRCPECGVALAISVVMAPSGRRSPEPPWLVQASHPYALLTTLCLGLGLTLGARAAATPILLWTVILADLRFTRWLRAYATNAMLPRDVRQWRYFVGAILFILVLIASVGVVLLPFGVR